MSDKPDEPVAYDPPERPFSELVIDHPVAAVVTAFVIGLLLAKLAL